MHNLLFVLFFRPFFLFSPSFFAFLYISCISVLRSCMFPLLSFPSFFAFLYVSCISVLCSCMLRYHRNLRWSFPAVPVCCDIIATFVSPFLLFLYVAISSQPPLVLSVLSSCGSLIMNYEL